MSRYLVKSSNDLITILFSFTLILSLISQKTEPAIRYQLWGGCFEEGPSTVLRRLNDSLPIDSRLYREDIQGSRCWAQELHRSGYLTMKDNEEIQQGLNKV